MQRFELFSLVSIQNMMFVCLCDFQIKSMDVCALWAPTASEYYSSMDCSCSFILAMFISRTSWISSHWIHRPISLKPYSTKTENAVDIRYRNTDILIKEIQTRKTEKSSEKAHFTHNHRQDNTFPRKMQVLLQHGDTIHELDCNLDHVSISLIFLILP